MKAAANSLPLLLLSCLVSAWRTSKKIGMAFLTSSWCSIFIRRAVMRLIAFIVVHQAGGNFYLCTLRLVRNVDAMSNTSVRISPPRHSQQTFHLESLRSEHYSALCCLMYFVSGGGVLLFALAAAGSQKSNSLI